MKINSQILATLHFVILARQSEENIMTTPLGIIGGTGLADTGLIENIKEKTVKTPFGSPSDSFLTGEISGKKVVFLSRHGPGHKLTPTNVPYRANIYGMKKLGVKRLISLCAVGSLKKEIRPLDVVLPDQYFDFTRHRTSSFFQDVGVVAHLSMPDPFCQELSGHFIRYLRENNISHHGTGTYLNMEGPQFSTRGESRVYRTWGMDIIGMTGATEAKLAREAGLCISLIATVSDYDCWHQTEEDVDMAVIFENLRKGREIVIQLLKDVVPNIPHIGSCNCYTDATSAIATALPGNLRKLAFLKLLDQIHK